MFNRFDIIGEIVNVESDSDILLSLVIDIKPKQIYIFLSGLSFHMELFLA